MRVSYPSRPDRTGTGAKVTRRPCCTHISRRSRSMQATRYAPTGQRPAAFGFRRASTTSMIRYVTRPAQPSAGRIPLRDWNARIASPSATNCRPSARSRRCLSSSRW
ncbi:hypothetical protein [Streptomyces sp. S.PB5]|uniref:hypothetical protein n=1 Tax=Streptomyces sp. S.PB5 TaxID=3020844 RepID=UPI0025AFC906|nr:hypothetical protein [Streptomyces sp. S.PB5]MDN3020286.1 hypothetical protein [Streptomyces sp. S.PB5]